MNTVVTREDIPKNLARRMKRFRLSREWTLKEAAEYAGISAPTWAYFENGKGIPTDRVASIMASRVPELFVKRRVA